MSFNLLDLAKRKISAAYDAVTGAESYGWSRVVMWQSCEAWLNALDPIKLSALEISGTFRSRATGPWTIRNSTSASTGSRSRSI